MRDLDHDGALMLVAAVVDLARRDAAGGENRAAHWLAELRADVGQPARVRIITAASDAPRKALRPAGGFPRRRR